MSMVGRGRRGLELGRGLEQDDAGDGVDGGQEEGEAAAAQERRKRAGRRRRQTRSERTYQGGVAVGTVRSFQISPSLHV